MKSIEESTTNHALIEKKHEYNCFGPKRIFPAHKFPKALHINVNLHFSNVFFRYNINITICLIFVIKCIGKKKKTTWARVLFYYVYMLRYLR